MKRIKLLSEIKYALDFIQYTDEEKKEVKKSFKKLKQDLKDLNRIKQENKELKLKNTTLKEDSNFYREKYLNDYDGLLQENTKLKKVIEILKKEPYIVEFGLENFTYNKFDNTYYYEVETYSYEDLDFRNKIYVMSKEKYDLLKEVLWDAK